MGTHSKTGEYVIILFKSRQRTGTGNKSLQAFGTMK